MRDKTLHHTVQQINERVLEILENSSLNLIKSNFMIWSTFASSFHNRHEFNFHIGQIDLNSLIFSEAVMPEII